jgi:hypothetical protein
MTERLTVEFETDDGRYQALLGEAERLKLPPEEVVRRAVAAWLVDHENDTTE